MFNKEELHVLKEIRDYLKGIFNLLQNDLSLDIVFTNSKGDIVMDAQFTLTPSTPLLATPVEKKGDGTVFQYDPTQLVYSVKDPTIVSFAENADGTALFTPLAVGSTLVGLVDKATGAQVVVNATVTQGTLPNTLDITWSAPPVATAKTT